MITIDRMCPFCTKLDAYEFDITQAQIDEWAFGMVIQKAMPELTPSQREVFITGMCYECQEGIFGGTDDE